MSRRFNVVIVGGGPAGTSTAINLAQAGVSVCLVTAHLFSNSLPGESLSPEACLELSKLFSRREALAGIGVPCHGIEAAWGSTKPTSHSYIFNPLGSGITVDRHEFHSLILDAARRAGICLLSPSHFRHVHRAANEWIVSVQHPRRCVENINCDFIVDATGRSAAVARLLGARRRRFDGLCAISANLDTAFTSRALMLQATSYGWWYATALPNKRSLICLISDIDLVKRLNAGNSNVWLDLLSRVELIASQLETMPHTARVRAHLCATTILDQVAGEAWLAVGDAGSTFDPLSSMGVLKALRSGEAAALGIIQYCNSKFAGLTQYIEQHRYAFMHHLKEQQRQYFIERRWHSQSFWGRREGEFHEEYSQ